MSILIVGISHNTAPIDLLERATLSSDEASKLACRALELPTVLESVVLATCNRVEIHVTTERFHGTVEALSELLAEHTGLPLATVIDHIQVHYDDAAVAHLFAVASGLDSMILGESQILGQLRSTLLQGQADETLGTELNTVFQQALRVGKRGHTETGIDRFAPSIVTAALDAAGQAVTGPQQRFLIAGAGTMSVLAVRTLLERGVAPGRIWLANRTFGRAVDLVEEHGVAALRWTSLDLELQNCDVLITCTGATDVVFDSERIATARAKPAHSGRPLTILDLALPRDVAPEVRELPDVEVIDLEVISELAVKSTRSDDVSEVRAIVEAEVRAFLAARKQAKVTPAVVALRSMATTVASAEADRLEAKLAHLDDKSRAEIRRSMQRVAEKLIHAPTVRVKELAEEDRTVTYADALTRLFELDPAVVQIVTTVEGDR